MSVKLMTEALYLEGVNPTEKLTLVALADHADDETRSAYPSIGRLARKTSQSKRTVQRTLRTLEERGLITCERRPNDTTLYHLTWRGVNLSGGDTAVMGGVTQLCHPNRHGTLEPSQRVSERDYGGDVGTTREADPFGEGAA